MSLKLWNFKIRLFVLGLWNSTWHILSLKFYVSLSRSCRGRHDSSRLCFRDFRRKPLSFALYANDKLDVYTKACMFSRCFLKQVIISLSSMPCCNQALTRLANNLKGTTHSWTLQIKTRPEQKLQIC